MMIVTRSSAAPLESLVMRNMFEARKRIFVDLLKWEVPVLDNRFEVDGFDDGEAVYLIVTDGAGTHLGSARLLKTTRPHILDSLFPQLVAGPIPSGPDVLEITRFCLDRRQDAASRRVTRNRLVSALVKHGLRHGIRAYSGVAELSWLQQILAFGWKCRPLGLPQQLGGAMLGALRIDIDADTPALLQQNGIWTAQAAPAAEALEAA